MQFTRTFAQELPIMPGRLRSISVLLVALTMAVVSVYLPSDEVLKRQYSQEIIRKRQAVTRPVELRLQLQWYHQAQFLGFYIAKFRGYYDDYGLDVKLLEYDGRNSPVDVVLSQHADIGLHTGDQLLIHHDQAGDDIQVLGTVFRQSMACFMSRASSDIWCPRDLRGKRVGVYGDFDTANLLRVLIEKHGVNRSDVRDIAVSSLDDFREDRVDVFPAYVFNEPLQMELEEEKVRLLKPDDFGVYFYSDTLFTTQKFAKSENGRILLRNFMAASIKGWQEAQRDPEKSVKFVREKVPFNEPKEGLEGKKANEVVKYLGDGPKEQIFHMERPRWLKMQQHLYERGALSTQRPELVDTLCDFGIVEESYDILLQTEVSR